MYFNSTALVTVKRVGEIATCHGTGNDILHVIFVLQFALYNMQLRDLF